MTAEDFRLIENSILNQYFKEDKNAVKSFEHNNGLTKVFLFDGSNRMFEVRDAKPGEFDIWLFLIGDKGKWITEVI